MNLSKIKKPKTKRLNSIFVFKIKYKKAICLKKQIKLKKIYCTNYYRIKMNKKL